METVEKVNSQERLLIIVEKLVSVPTVGMTNKALAFELKTHESSICRDMQILESQGWVEKINGKWRMSPKFGGFAGTMMKGFQTAKLRLTEDEARYASEMQ